jgi:two-component system, OmpR family, phosphate regulon sensor histidine kinase PhoR
VWASKLLGASALEKVYFKTAIFITEPALQRKDCLWFLQKFYKQSRRERASVDFSPAGAILCGMKGFKWFLHPIVILACSTLALVGSFFLYIYWYMEALSGFQAVVRKYNLNPDQFLDYHTWLVILVLSILVALILLGICTIFVYSQKTLQLFRLQHNFINNFTHELKTPVTSLRLYLETFARHELPRNEQLRYIQYMIQDADRLSGHISRILSLAQLESRNYKGKFSKADLVELTENFYRKNGHLFSGAEISSHNPSGRAWLYPVDQSLFEMLLMNLMTNAIKYNNSGAPRVDITFTRQKRDLRIHFADNGIGMERKQLKKIFRKFYQIGRSEDMTARGSGLGLHLAQNIARIHRGRIIARSEGIGKGAIFTLVLPLSTVEAN